MRDLYDEGHMDGASGQKIQAMFLYHVWRLLLRLAFVGLK